MYQALYRKWRPRVFADVVGQDHITGTLMNEINTGRHSHAYLFTGSRGTGKTTCAKIFAKAVNCEHPVNGDPCNECETCRGIDNGTILDIVEIDAASNNGVDNIRDIRDEANFTPVGAKYRVYIIDEVHMLSTGAFNALLKTLEEPPEHVKFVLATTEVHKMPATILSRCQRFDFKRIRPEDIAGRLAYVAEQEGLNLTPGAANLVARLADGALRDALSILDQCMGYGTDIDEAIVNEMVGLAGKDYLFALADCIIRNDSAGALEKINDLHNRSCDMERLCNELVNHFRNLMVAKAVHDAHDLIICSEQELEAYNSMAAACSMDEILNVLNVLGDTVTNLRKGLNRRVEMEMAVIRLCSGEPVERATYTVPKAAPAPAPAPKPAPAPAPTPAPAPVPEPTPEPEPIPEPVEEPQFQFSAPAEEEPVPPPEEEKPLEGQVGFFGMEEDVPPPPMEEAPAPAPAPVVEPEVEAIPSGPDISLQEEPEDGLIPTQVWNAVIREAVTNDKALIGCMNSAKAYKRGNALLLQTDNFLLKNFVNIEPHKTAIYNATYTVMGTYLNPRIAEADDVADFATDVPEEKEVLHEPKPKEEPEVPKKADPLDGFVDSIKMMGIDLTIEE